ncbi:MAG TPA: VCBS repeat-containing protein [Bryobacteraceae bacterium]|nr:VCBS repeat-containing protein [Bryobacteraceae bacterium]
MATSTKDGKLDLAVSALQSDAVFILLGNGDGTFQTPVEYPVGVSPFGVVVAGLLSSARD